MFPVLSSAAKEPPTKKKASPSPSPSSSPLTSLPYELSLNCLARVSTPDLAALPFVSKRYRSLVASSEFKEFRSQLGCTQECLYVCIGSSGDPTYKWYVIRREKRETVDSLVITPIAPSPSQKWLSSVVVRDWGIYVIGGFLNDMPTSDVWLLDCRTNTWRSVPSMGVARAEAVTGVVDGKVYVFEGDDGTDTSNYGEVFDPKTQTWDTLVPMLDREGNDGYRLYSLVMDKKVYGVSFTRGSVVYYSPGEGQWGKEMRQDLIETEDCPLWILLCGRGIDLENLLYGFDMILGEMFWRETGEREWKRVKGLEAHFNGDKDIREIMNFGLNVLFIWFVDKDEFLEIWCSEVSLKRVEKTGEVWGTVEWSGVLGTTHMFSALLHSASVNL